MGIEMHNCKKLSTAALLLISLTGAAFSSVKVAPYYSLTISEGVSVPSKNEWSFSLNLNNDLGVIVQPWADHKFIGLYELKYTGPGFRKEEGQNFTDRTMDHIFVFRHCYDFLEDYTLKTQLDYMNEYQRTGSNEQFGKSVYDNKRSGGGLTLERSFGSNRKAAVSVQYHVAEYPNYTDMYREYLQSQLTGNAEDIDSSTGKKNHAAYQGGVAVTLGATKIGFDSIILSYQKEHVVVDTVQSDGTYFSNDLQKDIILSANVARDIPVFKWLVVSPVVSCKMKDSNQNYQLQISSTAPVQYVRNYEDYQRFDLAVPVTLGLSKKWSYFCNPEWDYKLYTDRPARDSKNIFIAGSKQYNNLFILSTGFSYRPNAITRTTFYYTYQQQTSNVKFEQYLPYNYDGHFFGVSFNYTY
jgi:hypothetical protein